MRFFSLLALSLVTAMTASAADINTSYVMFSKSNNALIRLIHTTEDGVRVVRFSDCQLSADKQIGECKDLALMTEAQFKTMETCDWIVSTAGMVGFSGGVLGVVLSPFTAGLSLVPGAALSVLSFHEVDKTESQLHVYYFNGKEGESYTSLTPEEFIETLKSSLQKSWTSCHVNGQFLEN